MKTSIFATLLSMAICVGIPACMADEPTDAVEWPSLSEQQQQADACPASFGCIPAAIRDDHPGTSTHASMCCAPRAPEWAPRVARRQCTFIKISTKRGLHADTALFEIRLPGEIQNWNDPVESAMVMRQAGRQAGRQVGR